MMKRTLAAVLLFAIALQGCAQFTHAVTAAPQRTTEAFSDPIRREHIMAKSGFLALNMAGVAGCVLVLSPTVVGMLACPVVGVLANYLAYEFVLEPWSKARVQEGKPSWFGPYWERGPQDGERFIHE